MSKRVALGGAIRAIRVAKSLTPAHQIDKRTSHDPAAYIHGKFAVACLISASTLTNIEAGRRQPSPQVLERIAQQLRVDLDAISYACADCANKEIAA